MTELSSFSRRESALSKHLSGEALLPFSPSMIEGPSCSRRESALLKQLSGETLLPFSPFITEGLSCSRGESALLKYLSCEGPLGASTLQDFPEVGYAPDGGQFAING